MQIKDRIKELRRVQARELLPNPKNWRRHPKTQRTALKGIIDEIGYADAVLARETPDGLMLIDGHLRTETTPDATIPVLILDVDEREADILLASLNPLAAMGQNDTEALHALLSTIETENETTSENLSGILRELDRIAEQIYQPEYIDPKDLQAHPQNYLQHPDDQIDHLAQSLKEHGFYKNIVATFDGTILAGHGVVKAALRLNLRRIPVIRLDLAPSDPRALKLLAGDNEISNLTEVDDRILTEMLREIKENDPTGLLGTGYDDRMLENLVMVTRPKSEIKDVNYAAEWVDMPEFEGSGDDLKLVLHFDSEEERDDLVAELMKVDPTFEPRRRNNLTWTTPWPPRRK